MKVAVISDMHGNVPALQATLDHVEQWKPDTIVVNGDAVNRGPRSRDAWELIRARRELPGWLVVGGNHEDYVARWMEDAAAPGDPLFQIFRSSYVTYRQLGDLVAEIRELPFQVEIEGPGGTMIRVTHGSMLGNDKGIHHDTPESKLREQIAPAPDVFCTGHTHLPFVRRVNGTLVVNSGSAGTAFDGDPRISYAQLTWRGDGWQGEIVRLEYDRQQARRDFEMSDYLQEAGPLAKIFFQEWLLARPMVSRWIDRYQQAVIDGEIELERSVQEFLDDELS